MSSEPTFTQNQHVKHDSFGDGVVVSPKVKGGWVTVRFGAAAPIKCSPYRLSAAA